MITDKLENLLDKSDFVYEYEIKKINNKEIIYRIVYNSDPNKFINNLKINGINVNSSSDIWKIK